MNGADRDRGRDGRSKTSGGFVFTAGGREGRSSKKKGFGIERGPGQKVTDDGAVTHSRAFHREGAKGFLNLKEFPCGLYKCLWLSRSSK